MSLPSSQVSPPITMPSPQIGMQRAPIAGQIQPGSSWQSSAQPSPDVRVVVVARLRSADQAVPAGRPSQMQGCPGRGADPVRLRLAVGRAAVAALRVAVVAGLRGQVQLPVSARRDGAVEARRRVAGRPPIDGRRQIGRHHVEADIGRAVRVVSDASRGAVLVNLGDARGDGSGHHAAASAVDGKGRRGGASMIKIPAAPRQDRQGDDSPS